MALDYMQAYIYTQLLVSPWMVCMQHGQYSNTKKVLILILQECRPGGLTIRFPPNNNNIVRSACPYNNNLLVMHAYNYYYTGTCMHTTIKQKIYLCHPYAYIVLRCKQNVESCTDEGCICNPGYSVSSECCECIPGYVSDTPDQVDKSCRGIYDSQM